MSVVNEAAEARSLGSQEGVPPRGAMNLAYMLTQTAKRIPHEDALIQGELRWTWRELDQRVSALAQQLSERGVKPGQCVLLDGPNHPEFVQAMFAIWRLGAVVAPVNSRLHDRDIASIASVCRPVLMIAHQSTSSHVVAAREALGGTLDAMWLDSSGPEALASYTEPSSDLRDHHCWAGDPAWYFFTSGTSGTPKAAVLTHDQLGFVTTNYLADLMPTTTASDRSLVVAPLSHGAGVHLLPQVARGAATVIPVSASLKPSEVWELVERERVV
ncbi:MAG: AMP-binding protein, partial [Marmoricola sp.]